jgi:hypothetical protein
MKSRGYEIALIHGNNNISQKLLSAVDRCIPINDVLGIMKRSGEEIKQPDWKRICQ